MDPVLGNPSATTVILGNGTIKSSTFTTSSTVADQVIDTFDKTIYRSVKYQIQITHSNDFHITEIYAVHDTNSVHITEYGIILTNGALASFDVGLNGSNVELRATPTNNGSTVFKVMTTLINI